MALRLEVATLQQDVEELRSKISKTKTAINDRAGKGDVTVLVRELNELQRELKDCVTVLGALGQSNT
jgi:chaperonin cofactor prefoldin